MNDQAITSLHQLGHDRYIMRRRDVEQRTGFKRAYLYSLMKDGKFPRSKRIGLRAVGWDSQEIEQWVADRLAEV